MLRNAAVLALAITACVAAQARYFETSSDGREVIFLDEQHESETSAAGVGLGAPYPLVPDWSNTWRRQVGGLQVADMNNDGRNDLVVGCYNSNSFPPYKDWENFIHYNTGSEPEAIPSWVSDEQLSSGDLQVGDINNDGFLDIFSANGRTNPSTIHFGGPDGPDTSLDWSSQEPGQAWNNYAKLFDIDHDGDLDIATANQGFNEFDPVRPIFIFINDNGNVPIIPTWQSAIPDSQNFIDFADYDGDGWEDMAVSKWIGYESAIYKNVEGTIATSPIWTTGDDDSDKGVAWADVDGNGRPDLSLGHGPTQLWSNDDGALAVDWQATAPYFGHSELRFHDIDRDGDPDLCETHFADGRVHIYLNEDGQLSQTPSWTFDATFVGTAIAFGDINGDNWPDLITGNAGEPSINVFYNTHGPDVLGDLNGSGSVTAADLVSFQECYAGPNQPNPGCDHVQFANSDLDVDGDVDFADFQRWQQLVSATSE